MRASFCARKPLRAVTVVEMVELGMARLFFADRR
jgi:hypothetical protein